MLAFAKLYSTAIVLGVWAVLYAIGVHSDKLTGAGLALLAVTVVVSERQRARLRTRRNGRPARD